MARLISNRVRELREERGLTQVGLAAAASLSRQSVCAIEGGRAIPAVDVALRIAQSLDSRVEELFGTAIAVHTLTAESSSTPRVGRVALAQLAGRWVAYSLEGDGLRSSADGMVVRTRGRHVQVEPLRSPAQVRENVVLMGCAMGLGLLADRLNSRLGPGRFLWLSRSSTGALEALARDQTHVAGVHLVDAKTGEANVADVRRLAGGKARVLITLARWEAGLVMARANPKNLRAAADLGRRGLRLVVREHGSGARRLLERELRAARLPVGLVGSAPVHATSHLQVAHAISIGAADTGVATRDAAIAYGLAFVPLAEERYDLAISPEHLEDPRLQRLFDLLTAAAFRRELTSLGYDVRSCGDRVAEIDPA